MLLNGPSHNRRVGAIEAATAFKCGLYDVEKIEARSRYGVGSIAELMTLNFLWLDIDAVKDERYVSSDEALAAIKSVNPAPSVIVRSDGRNGGFHCYWLLDRPLSIAGDAEKAKSFRRRLVGLQKQLTIPTDSAPPATGILRLPGSQRKSGNVVTVSEFSGARYPIEAFPGAEDSKPATKEYNGTTLSGRTNAESIIAQYLDAIGKTVVSVLVGARWRVLSERELKHPTAGSGSRSGVLWHHDDGTLGVTIHSSNCQPFQQGSWYSREACWVLTRHDGDWKKAALEAHSYFDAQKPFVDISAILGGPVPLEKYRSEVNSALQERHDGMTICTAVAGAGKSHAAIEKIKAAGSATYVAPTHRNCREFGSQLDVHGIPAKSYPELNAETCEFAEDAKRLQVNGFDIGQTICRECELKKSCKYWAQLAHAEKAMNAIATLARWAYTDVDSRSLIVFDEDPSTGLILQESIPRSMLSTLKSYVETWLPTDWRASVRDVISKLESLAVGRAFFETLPYAAESRKGWQKLAWRDDFKHMKFLRPIVSIAAREAGMIIGLDDAILVQKKRHLPYGMPIVTLDATGDPVLLEKLVNYEPVDQVDITSIMKMGTTSIQDATPKAQPEIKNRPTQIPIELTRGMSHDAAHRKKSAKALARYVSALAVLGDHHRIGVITHSTLAGNFLKYVPKSIHWRIAKVAYFGGGEDRGSNTWLTEGLDCFIVAGTPRPPQTAILHELARHGEHPSLPPFEARNIRLPDGQELRGVLGYPPDSTADRLYHKLLTRNLA